MPLRTTSQGHPAISATASGPASTLGIEKSPRSWPASLGLRIQRQLDILGRRGLRDRDGFDAEFDGLSCQFRGSRSPTGERHDPKPPGLAADDIDRLGADRSRRTEQDHLAHRHPASVAAEARDGDGLVALEERESGRSQHSTSHGHRVRRPVRCQPRRARCAPHPSRCRAARHGHPGTTIGPPWCPRPAPCPSGPGASTGPERQPREHRLGRRIGEAAGRAPVVGDDRICGAVDLGERFPCARPPSE